MDAAARTSNGGVAADEGNWICLPARSIRKLGWERGDQLLVQPVSEDMVLLIRRPAKAATSSAHQGPVPPQSSEGVTVAGGDPGRDATHAPAYCRAAVPADEVEAPSPASPPPSDEAATAPVKLDRFIESLASRIAALEQRLTSDPTGAEAPGPGERRPATAAEIEPGTANACGPRAERARETSESQTPSSLRDLMAKAAVSWLGAGQREQLLALRSLLAAGIARIDAIES
jgi:hypothetical protein